MKPEHDTPPDMAFPEDEPISPRQREWYMRLCWFCAGAICMAAFMLFAKGMTG